MPARVVHPSLRLVVALVAALGLWAWAAAPTMTNLNPGTKPSQRTGAALVAAVGADGGELDVLFGGNSLFNTNNQTWTYSPNNWSQRTPAASPTARAWHSMSWDERERRVILFGGSAALGGPLNNQTWAFDPLTDTWTQLTNAGTIPSARFLATMVYVPHLQRHLLFGGGTATSGNAEATAVDGTAWLLDVNATAATATWTQLSPGGDNVPGRASACAGYDPVRRRLVVFGGEILMDQTLADTIEYDVDGNTWTVLSPATPPTKRGSAVCTWDERAGKLVMYGGVATVSGTPLSAAFEYDPRAQAWRPIAPSPNAGSLTFAAPTFSPLQGGMLFFGGRQSSISTSQATWTMRLNASPRLTLPTPLQFNEDVLVALPATVSDVDSADVHTWGWTQDGGAPVTLSSTSVAQPTFTTPRVTSPRALRFSVTVSDSVETDSAFVDVTVLDSINELPMADAGPDQFVDAGVLVRLSGSATDPNGEAMTYDWVQLAGPTVSLTAPTTLGPSFVAPRDGGALLFELRATDVRVGSGSDQVRVNVTPTPDVDAGLPDAGLPDAGLPDAGVPDAGRADAGTSDAGTFTDGGAITDAGASNDAGADTDAGTADAGPVADAGAAGDAGMDVDAGANTDAGVDLDAGTLSDAGMSGGPGTDGGTEPAVDAGEVDQQDAGTLQPRRVLSVGCASIDAAPLAMAVLLVLARRRRTTRGLKDPRAAHTASSGS